MELARDTVFIPAGDVFAEFLQMDGECEHRAESVCIGSGVAGDKNTMGGVEGFGDFVEI